MKYEEIKDFNDDIVKENSLWQEIMELKPIYQIILIVLILILFIVIIYLIVKFKSKVSDKNNSNVKPENETKKFKEDVINLMINDIKDGCIGKIEVSLLDENKNKWQELFSKFTVIIDDFKNIGSKKKEIINIKNDLIALISFGISVKNNLFQKISYNKFTELIKQIYIGLNKELIFMSTFIETIHNDNLIHFKKSKVETTEEFFQIETTEESFQISIGMNSYKYIIFIMFNPINEETKLVIEYYLNDKWLNYYDGALKPII